MAEPLRIGIDCRQLEDPERGQPTGIPASIYYLVLALLRLPKPEQKGIEWLLFFGAKQEIPVSLLHHARASVRRFPAVTQVPFLGSHIGVSLAVQRERVDVLHGPANILPLGRMGPSVLTIHDLLIYEHPEWFPSGQGISTRYLVPSSVARADRVIVPSAAVRDAVMKQFGKAEGAIRVVPHGVSAAFADVHIDAAWETLKQRHTFLEKPFVLFVGTIEPRKNIERLIEAFQQADLAEANLVLAGKIGWNMPDDFTNRLPENVHALGFVSEREKRALLRNARVFAYPSLGEGFGLPLLEAMREGAPVVTSDLAPMNELVEGVGWMADPESVPDLARALREATRERTEQGRERAATYTWEETARKTLHVYRETTG